MNRARWTGGQTALWLLRATISGIFIYAGAVKMRDPHAFAESVASFRLLPQILISPAALTLPPLEILAGIAALAGRNLRRAGAFCLLALLIVFLAALASAQARGLTVDCGCFGADKFDVLSPSKNLWIAQARDVALAVAAWVLYADSRRTNG